MTLEQMQMIRNLSATELGEIKDFIEKETSNRYEEMWWDHNKIDNYIYKVHLSNGDYRLFCKGKQAYDEYNKNDKAIMVERLTKDLFPKSNILLRKETA